MYKFKILLKNGRIRKIEASGFYDAYKQLGEECLEIATENSCGRMESLDIPSCGNEIITKILRETDRTFSFPVNRILVNEIAEFSGRYIPESETVLNPEDGSKFPEVFCYVNIPCLGFIPLTKAIALGFVTIGTDEGGETKPIKIAPGNVCREICISHNLYSDDTIFRSCFKY